MAGEQRIYTLTALTDIWTGSVQLEERNAQLRERIVPDRLITTGLLGSIRWWFEVVVRGLGGAACDPTLDGNRCPDPKKDPADPGHHCVVCELFGCTGWARKFRFDVLDENDQPKQTQIKKGETFKLRFTELRPICETEWALLDLTLRLIAEYGAIGGKTVYKPSDEANRANQAHHRDYGLIKIEEVPEVPHKTHEQLKGYAGGSSWPKPNHGDAAWASLAHFWCVKCKYLARQHQNCSTFNRVLGRREQKHQGQQLANRNEGIARWLAGSQRETKKVFSFKNPARTFGFVRSTTKLNEMRQRLKDNAWADLKDDEFLTSDTILASLLKGGGTA